MLTFVTIPHAATTISELGEKSFAAEEAGSIFPKSATPGALSLCEGLGQSHFTDRNGIGIRREGT